MRQVSAGLQTAITSANGMAAVELWTFYFAAGTTRWTNNPTDVTYSATTWTAGQALLSPGRIFGSTGTDPVSLTVTVVGSATISGSSITQSSLGLTFRGVRAVLQWLIYDSAGSAQGLLTVFDGHVTGIRTMTKGVELVITGPMSSASVRQGEMPIEVSCPLVVYSTQCGATPITLNRTTAAGCTSTALVLTVAPTGMVAGSQATLPDGTKALVRSVAGTTVTVDRAIPVVAAGQTIAFTRGCDKRFTTCSTVFSNAAHYSGCPWRPVKSLTQ